MSHEPVASVIIPAYNGAAFVSGAIDSVLDQTYGNIEIIVVNDASTDDTEQVVGAYSDKVVYVGREQNGGIGAARNTGIAQATGEFLAFLDADDIWLPDRVSLCMAAFTRRENVGLVATNTLVWDEKRGTKTPLWGSVVKTGDRITKRILRDNFMSASGGMVSREALEAVGGYDETLTAAEDYDLWYRIARSFEVELVEEPVTVWRYHTASYSSNVERQVLNLIRFYEKVLEVETHAEEREIAEARRKDYLFKLGILRSVARKDGEAKDIFADVVSAGAPSTIVSFAIGLHEVSPVLFRLARSMRLKRAPEVLSNLELVI
ncbi:MAG: glycosyltransferase [Candidatus Aquicultorales bacterium]